MIAPWDRDDCPAGPPVQHTRLRPTWEQGSLDAIERAKQDEHKRAAAVYTINSPWIAQENDDMARFEKEIAAVDYQIDRPWERDTPGDNYTSMRQNAGKAALESGITGSEPEQYKFRTLWEPPKMSAEKVEQLENYVYCPPFSYGDNAIQEKIKGSGKVKIEKTHPPWLYGQLPAPPAPEPPPREPFTLWDQTEKPKSVEDVESSGDPILDSLRKQLKANGAPGILGLARKFKIMDDDGSGQLDMAEFTKGMQELQICDLTPKALQHLFRYFDKDGSGYISLEEFLVGVRGQLNARRKALVHLAYDVLDVDGSGVVDIEDFRLAYNAKSHLEVRSGKKTEDQVLTEMMALFEIGKKDKDGVITREEFENYYSGISALIDSDDYFELMIRNAWHISGGQGVCENTTVKRILVTYPDGTQKIEEVKGDFGSRARRGLGLVERIRQQTTQVVPPATAGAGASARRGSLGAASVAGSVGSARSSQNSARMKPKSLAELAGELAVGNAAAAPVVNPAAPGQQAQQLQQSQQQQQQQQQQQRPPSGRSAAGGLSHYSVTSNGSGRLKAPPQVVPTLQIPQSNSSRR